jgi:hypothetical protein
MNIERVKEISNRDEYLALKNNIEIAVKESKGIMIFEESDIDKAGFYIKKFKELDKKIERVRKDIVSPINDEVKEINNVFENLSALFTPELTRLDRESNELLKEVRAKQEAIRLAEQKELDDELINEAIAYNDDTVLDVKQEIQFKTTGLDATTLTTARSKTWELIDLDLVPRKYLILDEKMINQVRKDFDFEVKEQPISGIKFTFLEKVRVK